MYNAKKTVLIVMGICVSLASVCLAEDGERVLHFPADCSLGSIFICDENISKDTDNYYHWKPEVGSWEPLCAAKGDVRVPAGKLVQLDVVGKKAKNLKGLLDLEPDDIYLLRIRKWPEYTPGNNCMKYVRHLTGLKRLDISKTDVTSRGLFQIRNLKSLEALSLGNSVTNSGMKVIASLDKLKGVHLYGTQITNQGLLRICNLEALEGLSLNETMVDDEGLGYLSKMKSLRYLSLDGANFTDAGMVHVKNIKTLKTFHLGHSPNVTDSGVKHISEHPGLEELNFYGNGNITNEGAKYLSTMRTLKMVDFRTTKIDDIGVGYISNCKALEQIDLPRTGITDVALKHLSTINGLKAISLPVTFYTVPDRVSNHFTNKGLRDISKLVELERLEIGGFNIRDAGMEHIKKLQKLKYLRLSWCPVTDDGIEKLTGLKSLETISLTSTKITVSGLNKLNAMSGLKKVYIGGLEQDGSVMDISGLTKLEYLSLFLGSKVSFQDADLACLEKLKQIESLHLNSKGVCDKDLSHLRNLTNLRYLSLVGKSNITDAGLKHIANMNKLNRLIIRGGHITDEGLRLLENLPALEWVEITSDTAFSKEAMERLREKIPDIRIQYEHRKPD